MKKISFEKLGWVVAALLAGIMFGGGFQEGPIKLAVVDITTVVETSEFGKNNQAQFSAMKTAREGVLEFIDTYRILTTQQAIDIRDLSIKPTVSAEDKNKLERVKLEVMTAHKKNEGLIQKPNLTPEDRKLLEEYATLSATMEETARTWLRDFTNELQTWADAQKLESLKRARAAVQEIGKAQGLTTVFEVGIAPYGATDITDPALKAMNAKK